MTRREPPIESDVVEPPEDFDDEQREVFEAIVTNLAAVGIIVKLSDAYTVERAAVGLVNARRARAYIVENGRYHDGKNGLTLHPAVRDEKNAWADFASASSALGLSPLDRERIQANESAEDDPLDDIAAEFAAELAADRMASESKTDAAAPSTPARARKKPAAKAKPRTKGKAAAKRAPTKPKK